MMRLILALSWGLAIFWLTASPLEAQQGRGKFVKINKDPESHDVVGYGLNIDAAKKNALKKIREEISKEASPKIWRPSPEFLKQKMLAGEGKQGEDFTPDPQDNNVAGPFKTWVYPVKPIDLDMIGRLDEEAHRLLRAQERIPLFGYFLGGTSLLIAFLAGALSVREWYKNRPAAKKKLAKPDQPNQATQQQHAT